MFYLRKSGIKEYKFRIVSKKYIKVQNLGKRDDRLQNKFSHSINLRIFESLSSDFSNFIFKRIRTMWRVMHWHRE